MDALVDADMDTEAVDETAADVPVAWTSAQVGTLLPSVQMPMLLCPCNRIIAEYESEDEQVRVSRYYC